MFMNIPIVTKRDCITGRSCLPYVEDHNNFMYVWRPTAMLFPWEDVPDFHMLSDTEKMEFWIQWKKDHKEQWQSLHTKWNFSDIDPSPWDTYDTSARIVESEWRERERKLNL